MAEKLCSFCHQNCDLNKIQIKKTYRGSEYICYDCYKRTGIDNFVKIAAMTADEIRPYIEQADLYVERRGEFKATDYIKGIFEIDRKNQFFAQLCGHLINDSPVYAFYEIESYRLVVDDKTYTREQMSADGFFDERLYNDLPKKKSGLFKLPQKCKKMQFIVDVKSMTAPLVTVDLLQAPAKYDSKAFESAVNSAKECADMFENMIISAVIPEDDDG